MRTSILLRTFVTAILGLCAASCLRLPDQHVNFPLSVSKEMELHTRGDAVAVAFSPDGSRIAAASNYGGSLTVWDSAGHQISQIDVGGGGPHLSGALAFANGSSQLLFAPPQNTSPDVALAVRDVNSGAIVTMFNGPNAGKRAPNQGSYLAISPDQRFLAIGTGVAFPPDILVAVYDPNGWQLTRSYAIDHSVFSLNLFANGKEIIVGGYDGSITILDPSSPNELAQFRAWDESQYGSRDVTAVAGSPDGAYVFAGAGSGGVFSNVPGYFKWSTSFLPARVLRASDGAPAATFPVDAGQEVGQAQWDPKGRYVAFTDHRGNLFLWRPLSPKLSYEKISVPGGGWYLAISPDGGRIAVSTGSGVIVYSVK